MAARYDALLGALRLRDFAWVTPPYSPTAPGNAGDVAYDANYLYLCVAANTWERAAIATWTPPGSSGQAIGIFPYTLTYA